MNASFQKLENLEKEEDLKQLAGEYDSDSESDDEEMRDIRKLAAQIREKKKMRILLSREKQTKKGPKMPRTAKKASSFLSLYDISSMFSYSRSYGAYA